MSSFHEAASRDTVLFINGVRKQTFTALDTYETRYGKKLRMLVFVDAKRNKLINSLNKQKQISNKKITVEAVDFDSPVALRKKLEKYRENLLAVTCQFENSIPYLEKIIPHLPYLDTPTQSSLDWSTDKIVMRQLLKTQDKSLIPKYTVIKDASPESVARVEKQVGYPVVVKPAGLAASLLVSVCYHRDELEITLKKTFKTIDKVYKNKLGRGIPKILVEQLMDGEMYSIDVYVNGRGNTYATPIVHVKTGRAIGFDDFFGYQRTTPTRLLKSHIEDANHAASKAVKALGLRSTTAHVELMRTEKEWKIIELAPRMGGFRHEMYQLSYGINHILNDILVRVPQKPIIPKKTRGFTAVFNIYGKTEGVLGTILGLKQTRLLASYTSMEVNKVKGDELKFAKNGGSPVLEVILFNKTRPELLADIRRMEKAIAIEVIKPVRRKNSSL
jgi:biotin carboxylase